MTIPPLPDHYDGEIAIAGGGLVGATLAIALAQSGFQTLLIDALAPEKAVAPDFDGRVSAIAFASRRLLETIGLWQRMAQHAQPINDILVSDGHVRRGASPLFLHFDHSEIGDEPLGHIVENRHTRMALQELARETPRLEIRAPARAQTLTRESQSLTLGLADGARARARLCIVADGRGSALRQAAGIKTIGWDYGQTGIVATVAHEKSHHGWAQEYFLPSGPFAILPMTENRSSLVWTERADRAAAFLALDAEAFEGQIAARFGPYLGTTRVTGPRWSYPLRLELARSYVQPRLALIGDAAHGIHPIAGQGFNLGLRDVAALAEVLTDAARLGEDVGAIDVLERYERWRRFDTVTLAAATDVLNRLFSNDIAPLRMLRDLGLSATGMIGPVRRLFMRHAGGSVGHLPRLLRGEPL